MDKGSNYLNIGKKAMILTTDSHVDGEFLVLQVTPQFLETWKSITSGKNYQTNIDKYLLLSIIEHKKYCKISNDDIVGIACVLDVIKDVFVTEQTDILQFSTGVE